jgi:hypothetical protein
MQGSSRRIKGSAGGASAVRRVIGFIAQRLPNPIDSSNVRAGSCRINCRARRGSGSGLRKSFASIGRITAAAAAPQTTQSAIMITLIRKFSFPKLGHEDNAADKQAIQPKPEGVG